MNIDLQVSLLMYVVYLFGAIGAVSVVLFLKHKFTPATVPSDFKTSEESDLLFHMYLLKLLIRFKVGESKIPKDLIFPLSEYLSKDLREEFSIEEFAEVSNRNENILKDIYSHRSETSEVSISIGEKGYPKDGVQRASC